MHVENKLQGACRSGSHTTRKERIPFGMNLSEEDDASNSGSTSQTDMQLALIVDRFYARKFSMKTDSGADKRAVLKVSKTGTVKKQKTPNKSCIQGVLQVVGQEGLDKLINQEQT
jgi:hypothetical protein